MSDSDDLSTDLSSSDEENVPKQEYTKINDDIRKRLIDCLVNNRGSIPDVARMFDIHYQTVYAIWNVYMKTGRTTKLKRGGFKKRK